MTDKELLELAAKAAGYELDFSQKYHRNINDAYLNDCLWNPLTDDGDALRLAVKLDINVYVQLIDGFTMASVKPEIDEIESHGNDSYAATRRAIVRAAAQIGKNVS
jgi:hypothetical protein